MALIPMGVLDIAVVYTLEACDGQEKRRLPPGPAGLPAVDNIQDMLKTREWETFAR